MTDKAQPTEDIVRARLYLLLSNLLAAPPDADLLSLAGRLDGEATSLGSSLRDIGTAARAASTVSVAAEYHELFIGIGRGELMPYGSYYLTGFVNERPLARLREDLRSLGIARAADNHEPEDHIAALCEVMSGLISAASDGTAARATPRLFFDAHLKPWAARFFSDLAQARAARFYRPVGRLGLALLDHDAALSGRPARKAGITAPAGRAPSS